MKKKRATRSTLINQNPTATTCQNFQPCIRRTFPGQGFALNMHGFGSQKSAQCRMVPFLLSCTFIRSLSTQGFTFPVSRTASAGKSFVGNYWRISF
jgi:hypothetical protein